MAQVPVKPKTFEEVLINISSAKWTSGSEPSPWYDVDNLVPWSLDATVPFHLFGNFPPEIILYMVQFLPKESAIALALTNKRMLQLIGERVFDGLTDEERWRLVLLLERDTVLVTACHYCRRLHNGVSKGDKFSLAMGFACNSGDGSMLPYGVTLVQCRLVMRQYLRQQPYTDFLTISNGTRVLSLPDFKVFQSSTLRVVNGHLLFRSESLIAPFSSAETSEIATEESNQEGEGTPGRTANDNDFQMAKNVSGHGAYLLHKLSTHGDRRLVLAHGCSHQNATSLGFCFPRNDPKENTNTRFLRTAYTETFQKEKAFVTDHDQANHVFWHKDLTSHPEECYGSTFVAPGVFRNALHPTMECALYHDQPCVEVKDCEAMVGRVRSCPECFTDR
ncbi:hypothetical protein V8F33_011312 [Rhypophila sp. PSN 637]